MSFGKLYGSYVNIGTEIPGDFKLFQVSVKSWKRIECVKNQSHTVKCEFHSVFPDSYYPHFIKTKMFNQNYTNWCLYLLCRKKAAMMMMAAVTRITGTAIIAMFLMLVSLSSVFLENITFPAVSENFPTLT